MLRQHATLKSASAPTARKSSRDGAPGSTRQSDSDGQHEKIDSTHKARSTHVNGHFDLSPGRISTDCVVSYGSL